MNPDIPAHEFIHIGDVVRLLKRYKKRYLVLVVFCAVLSMGLVSLLEPKYLLKASFKEASIKSETSSAHMLKTLLKNPSHNDLGTQALSVMKSRQLLEGVVAALHLQGEVKVAPLTHRLLIRMSKRWHCAPSEELSCQCKNIRYKGKEIKRFYVRSNASGGIEVYSLQQHQVLTRRSDDSYHEGELTFSLDIVPQWKKMTVPFLIKIYPMQTAIDRVAEHLKIKVRREDVTVLDLMYQDVDPGRGAAVLNTLMQYYQHYLFQENERIAGAQLEYLTRRQQEIAEKLDTILHTHVEYLQSHLGAEGLMGLHQELEMIESRKKRHQQRVLEIDLDLNKLHQMQKKKLFMVDSFGVEGKKLQQELLGLKKQKEMWAVAQFKRGHSVAQLKNTQKRTRKVLHTHNTFEGIHKLHTHKEEVARKIVQGPYLTLPVFALLRTQMSKTSDGEVVLQEGRVGATREFQGIDLEMAKQLYIEYTHQLDEILLRKKELELALDNIQDKNFDVSSLAHLAGEGISQEVIQETMHLSTDLKNEKYFSDKDRSRMREQLERNIQFLTHHFLDRMTLTDLRAETIADKLQQLQQRMKHLVDREIDCVEEQLEQLVAEQLAALQAEKNYIQERMQEVQEELKGIPSKWLMENRMQLQSDLNISMMEGMSQLVESKNIEHHLLQVESKPIDEAYIPLKPTHSSLLLYGICGGLFGFLSIFGCDIGRRVLRGFPVSIPGLRYRSLHAIGPFPYKTFSVLEKLSAQQLDMLRQIAYFLFPQERVTAGVILNGQADYTTLLGELLTLSGKTTLLIELFPSKGHTGGIVDYLTGRCKELTVIRKEGLDRISLGSHHPYAMEILNRKEGQVLLKTFQERYQMVLMVTRGTVTCSETKKLIDYCHKMVITLDEESVDDLYPYIRHEAKAQHPFALYVAFE